MRRGAMWPVAVCVAVMACGGGHHSHAAPTLSATASSTPVPSGVTPRPAATPTPDPITSALTGPATTVDHVPVRWLPTQSPIDLPPLSEASDPWGTLRAQHAKSTPDIGPTRWGIYTMDLEGGVSQVYATRRYVEPPTWDDQGIHAVVHTLRIDPRSLETAPRTYRWQGEVNIDPASDSATVTLDPFPTHGGNDPANGAQFMVERNPLNGAGLFHVESGGSNPITVIFRDGNARIPDGLPSLSAGGWLAGSTIITAERILPGDDPRTPGGRRIADYFIPTQDGSALVVTSFVRVVRRSTPTGSRYLYFTRLAGDTSDVGLLLYDSATNDVRDLGRIAWTNPSQLQWIDDNTLEYGTQRLDLQTLTLGPIPPPIASPAPVLTSPDGRRTATLEHTHRIRPGDECAGQPFRLTVSDLQAGTSFAPLGCETGSNGTLQWTDNDHVFLAIDQCLGCGKVNGQVGPKASFNYVIEDLATNTTVPLSQGPVSDTFAAEAPDGRVLLVGATIQLFAPDGTLLRDWGPPPTGYVFQSAVWAPDASNFALLIGPSLWDFVP